MLSSKWYLRLLLILSLVLLLVAPLLADEPSPTDLLCVGIFADLHAHDTNSPGEKKVMVNYGERLQAFVDAMNAWPADLVIELGDFVNGRFVSGVPLGEPERIVGILEQAEAIYAKLTIPRCYVLGNHDVYDLSKAEFLEGTGALSTTTSFDAGGYHFVFLNAQFNKNGEDYGHVSWMVQGRIPKTQLAWLREDLAATENPTIVCIHQPLDVAFSLTAGGPPVANSDEVKALLAESDVVLAVFQGHEHENAYSLIEGIHYITFEALIAHTEPTPPSWAMVTLDPIARTITIRGKGQQADWDLEY